MPGMSLHLTGLKEQLSPLNMVAIPHLAMGVEIHVLEFNVKNSFWNGATDQMV